MYILKHGEKNRKSAKKRLTGFLLGFSGGVVRKPHIHAAFVQGGMHGPNPR